MDVQHPHPLDGALSGIRIIDFSQIAAGPLCTMLLADMGADVVKVEPPCGEVGRMLGPPFVAGESTAFMALNRNKRGVVIDLKTEAGLIQASRLIAEADVLVESFRPGVAARLGIGYDDMTALNPRLIYCSISAYGQCGPWAERPGVDGVVQAVSGLMSITGSEGAPPSKVQAPITDMATGYQATIAVLAALRGREAGGRPGHLDVNLLASSLMLQQVPLAGYLASGKVPRRCGSGAPYATPNEAYETADGHILVAAYQDRHWRRFCEAIGAPRLATDPRFALLPERMVHRAALTDALNAVFRARRTADWLAVLEVADIICAPVSDYDRLATSPQLQAAGLLIDVEHPLAGTVTAPGFAIGGRPMPVRRPSPLLGEHNALLAEVTSESDNAEPPDRQAARVI
jgi:crotonobetainyl-CoA:carnitine CoA-transferase CaiB-like acyl-CoA transferase